MSAVDNPRRARPRPGALTIWTFILLGCLAGHGKSIAAQGPAANRPRTTKMGVYSREQWTRGRDLYAGMCASCHQASTHVGPVFTQKWAGKRLSDLFGFVKQEMPKNDPGSLAWEDYVDAIAYILRLNGMPVGQQDLPVDSLALSRIRIDSSLAAPPAPTPRR
jgi:mono/diheme cytochrome c family protein